MNGILNILKPPGMTSFDVVAFLRRVLKTKKIGHSGTLDPMAVGVLPVCIGNYTKLLQYLTENTKIYRFEMVLGIETDTMDAEGTVLSNEKIYRDEERIIDAVNSFVGGYEQLPPMYSAVKVNGKKLYEFAREGKQIERKKRFINIYKIDIIRIYQNEGYTRILIEVNCSKGTYVRALCTDIAEKMGCKACVTFLERTGTGYFSIDDTITLDELCKQKEQGKLEDSFIALEKVLSEYKKIILDNMNERVFKNGGYIKTDYIDSNVDKYIVYNENGTFLGIGKYVSKNNELFFKCEKLFDI